MSVWKHSQRGERERQFRTLVCVSKRRRGSEEHNAKSPAERRVRIVGEKRSRYSRKFTRMSSMLETIFSTKSPPNSFGDMEPSSWKTSISKVSHGACSQNQFTMHRGHHS